MDICSNLWIGAGESDFPSHEVVAAKHTYLGMGHSRHRQGVHSLRRHEPVETRHGVARGGASLADRLGCLALQLQVVATNKLVFCSLLLNKHFIVHCIVHCAFVLLFCCQLCSDTCTVDVGRRTEVWRAKAGGMPSWQGSRQRLW